MQGSKPWPKRLLAYAAMLKVNKLHADVKCILKNLVSIFYFVNNADV